MAGIVVAGHGHLATALKDATALIVGPQPDVQAVDLAASDNIDEWADALSVAVSRRADSGGVLLLVDLFGASPFLHASRSLRSAGVEVVTGVNLPMLLAAIERRSDGLEAMTAAARAAGIDGIRNARESLPAVKAETT